MAMLSLTNYLRTKLDQFEGLEMTATILDNITKYYYDHEIHGMHKIPRNGAALLVYYHGAIPVDYMALVSRIYLRNISIL